jgi:hypothetical protein
MLAINRGMISYPAAPFGGNKQSGLGREGGLDGIHELREFRWTDFKKFKHDGVEVIIVSTSPLWYGLKKELFFYEKINRETLGQ